METVTITVDKRTDSGKKSSAALRRAGKIPCIIYGLAKSEKLAVNASALGKALSGPSGTHVILQLELGDGKGIHNAMLKELQYHPVTDSLVHADLLEIDLNKPIRVKLPLEFEGDALGVKVKGGELRVHMREMNVECMPSVMPRTLKVNIVELDLNKVWHVSDIPLPEGIQSKEAPESAVVSCQTIKEVKEAAPVAAVADATAAPAAGTAAAPAAGGKASDGKAPAAGGKAPAAGKAPAGKAPAGKK
jgi:large subunit ribosomal protein L25